MKMGGGGGGREGGGEVQELEESVIIYILAQGAKNCELFVKRDL